MSSMSSLIGKMFRKLSGNNRCNDKVNNIVNEYVDVMSKECYVMEVVKGTPLPTDSHMGGVPYMPINAKWPLDKYKNEIPFLIQINFENIKLNKFPDKGILQVFYSWETKEQEIRFYEEIDDNYQDESCLPGWYFEEGYTSGTPIKISLKKFKEVNPNFLFCNKFKELFEKYYNEEYDFTKYDKYKEDIDLIEKELKKYITNGNIGGWASSSQGYFNEMKGLLTKEGNEIFFFIDCMLNYDLINFGDGGCFWGEINPKDLNERNFENIKIKTDCN